MKKQEKVNILMVDDQPAKLLTYEVVLKELGENLIRASSAKDAMEVLLKNDIAVVLMDVSMPELDGFELADMIRQHPRFERTAIIFISGVHLTDLDRIKGYQRGAADYITVPVVPELLRAKVSVFAELHRKTRQLERLNRDLEERVTERTEELDRRAEALERLNRELMQKNQELNAILRPRRTLSSIGGKMEPGIISATDSMNTQGLPWARPVVLAGWITFTRTTGSEASRSGTSAFGPVITTSRNTACVDPMEPIAGSALGLCPFAIPKVSLPDGTALVLTFMIANC